MKPSLLIRRFSVGVLLLIAGTAGRSQEPPPPLGALAERIPVAGVDASVDALREMATGGARYLLGLPRRNELYTLFVAPIRHLKIEEWEEREVPHRWVVTQRPVYEYESYQVLERDRYGEVRQVTRNRPVKQIGTEEHRYLVRDPEGTVMKTVRVPAKRSADSFQGPALLYAGMLGQNGLALYALSEAGVPVDMDPLPEVVNVLVEHLNRYGLPDRTWDLTWLAAGLARHADGNPAVTPLVADLANKLLLGQIDEGPGSGLWGPFSVNPGLLATMVAYENKTFQDPMRGLLQTLRDTPDSRRAQERMAELQRAQDAFTKQYAGLDQTLREQKGHDIFRQRFLDLDHNPDEPEHWLRVFGMPVLGVGERLGDLESTTQALFALTELRRRGLLPAQTRSPVDTQGRDLVPPVQTVAILNRAAPGVTRARLPNGGFHEGNILQRVTAFDGMGYPGLPVDAAALPTLPAEMTFASVLEGTMAATLVSGLLNTPPPRGLDALMSSLENRISTEIVPNAYAGTEPFLRPYAHMLRMAGLGHLPQGMENAFVEHLLKTRDAETGGWGKVVPFQRTANSSLARFLNAVVDGGLDRRLAGATGQTAELTSQERSQALQRYMRGFGRDYQSDLFATAGALITLSRAVEGPVAGVWVPGEHGRLIGPVLVRILEATRLHAQSKRKMTLFPLTEDLSNLSGDLPLVFASGNGAAEMPEGMGRYVAGDGLLIALGTGAAGGKAFLVSMESALRTQFPDWPITDEAVGDGTLRLRTLSRPDQTVAGLFFLIEDAPGGSGDFPVLSGADAFPLLRDVLIQRLGDAGLNPQAAIQEEGLFQ